MSVQQTDLGGLKAFVGSHQESFSQPKQWDYAPVFMPVSTEGKPVVKVTTRLDFLKGQIGQWREVKICYFLSFGLGALALILLSVNVLLGVAFGLAAGWFYGQYVRDDFFIMQINKKRPLLEGT
ncbi:hypothetical protein COX85_03795 [Candidatus Micrarchaeota archaeon CG_4_10_14_0_2_um_filter_55_9]|nr:MAG: hypothetical protein AUJ16_04335 [Candidatus Micrarchaeota archaeon CG1_02_60_51]PIZ91452.1 MAG: hypothetical protein COX85_03795 [Candidatus Micrarchaeota archaeon CG_4_10_14_0_2_um_filter_55_9]